MKRSLALLLAAGIAASCGGKSTGVDGAGGSGGSSGRQASGGETSSGGVKARGGSGGAVQGSGGAPRGSGGATRGSGGAEAACRYNSDCAPPLVCASDLQCRNQCVTARDCPTNQLCQFGVCAPPTTGAGGSSDGGVTTPKVDAGRCAVPSSPIYGCAWDPAATNGCPPAPGDRAGTGGKPGGYPLGCSVQLPQLDGFSGCGPQRCTCDGGPRPGGSLQPTWVCPL